MGVGVGAGVVMGGPKRKTQDKSIRVKTGAQVNKTLLKKLIAATSPQANYLFITNLNLIRHSTAFKQ